MFLRPAYAQVDAAVIFSCSEFARIVSGTQPMANRACFRMPETKDEVTIPDDVETIKDLRHHICTQVLGLPNLSCCFRAWTNQGSKKKTVVLKDAQYIIDLEDNHSGGKHLVITIKEGSTSDRRKEQYQKLKRRQQLEPEDTQHHNRKQARLDKIVCGICNRAECNGTSCDPYESI